MRRVPVAVAVVTVEAGGARAGLTVASLVSLSLDPPLVGFAVRRDAALHELLREAEELAISVLAEGQEHLAQHFARGVPPIALWERIPLRDDSAGPPQLADAAAWLRGRVDQEHATGDHTFFVGEIVALDEGARAPGLVYREHGYHPV